MGKIIIGILIFISSYAKMYEITEPDVINEVENRKDKVIDNIQKYQKKAKEQVENHKGLDLRQADSNSTSYVNPTYVLGKEIPSYDRQGNKTGVLYPKGYKFNPLKYTSVAPPEMIIFNPCDKKEAAFVKEYIKSNSYVMLISSGCKQKNIKWQDYGMSIYALNKELVEKLELKETISIVTTDLDKKRIKVETIKP